MLAAARGHSDAGARRRRTGESHMRRNLFKWAVFGLDSYDLVLLADVDIDLMPAEQSPRAISKQWRELLPAFIRQPETARSSGSRGWGTDGSLPSAIDAPLFVGNADVSSPINNGLFLARPSRDLYQDGIRTLRRCVFNVTTGWERVGRPTVLVTPCPERRALRMSVPRLALCLARTMRVPYLTPRETHHLQAPYNLGILPIRHQSGPRAQRSSLCCTLHGRRSE